MKPLCIAIAFLVLLGGTFIAAPVQADDDWKFGLNFRFGGAISTAPNADFQLESGAGLVGAMAFEFATEANVGFGVDLGGIVDFEDQGAGISRFTTDLYLLHRGPLEGDDWITFRTGPSVWYAGAGTASRCGDECTTEQQARREVIDAHDTVVFGAMLSVGVGRAFGPLLIGADLRGRLGYGVADEVAPLRGTLSLSLSFTLRVPPKDDYSD